MKGYAIYAISFFFQMSSWAIFIIFLFSTRVSLKIGRRAICDPLATSLTSLL